MSSQASRDPVGAGAVAGPLAVAGRCGGCGGPDTDPASTTSRPVMSSSPANTPLCPVVSYVWLRPHPARGSSHMVVAIVRRRRPLPCDSYHRPFGLLVL